MRTEPRIFPKDHDKATDFYDRMEGQYESILNRLDDVADQVERRGMERIHVIDLFGIMLWLMFHEERIMRDLKDNGGEGIEELRWSILSRSTGIDFWKEYTHSLRQLDSLNLKSIIKPERLLYAKWLNEHHEPPIASDLIDELVRIVSESQKLVVHSYDIGHPQRESIFFGLEQASPYRRALHRWMDRERLTTWSFGLPQSVRNLMYRIQQTKDAWIFNPFCGYAPNAFRHNGKWYGQELRPDIAARVGLMLNLERKVSKSKIETCDSIDCFDHGAQAGCNVLVTVPPFGLPLKQYPEFKNINDFMLAKAHSFMRTGDEAIILLSQSAFFSRGTARDLRAKLIEADLVDTVIGLPQNVLYGARISSSVLVLRKKKEKPGFVRFIHAGELVTKGETENELNMKAIELVLEAKNDGKFVRFVPVEEVKENQYSLHADRYVFTLATLSGVGSRSIFDDLEGKKVPTEIVSSIGDLLKPYRKPYPENGQKARQISFKELRDLEGSKLSDFEHLELTDIKRGSLLAHPSSIIIGLQGEHLMMCQYTGDEMIAVHPNLHVFEVSDSIDPQFLLEYLASADEEGLFRAYRVGETVKRIPQRDFLDMKLGIPADELQGKYVAERIESRVLEAKNILEEEQLIYQRTRREKDSFLKHKIAGRLSNAISALIGIKEILDSRVYNELPGSADFTKEGGRLTLDRYVTIMERDLNDVQSILRSTGTGVEFMMANLQLKELDFLGFFMRYVSELKDSIGDQYLFNADAVLLNLVDLPYNLEKVILLADESTMVQAFDNIIRNAENHAFQKESQTERLEIHVEIHFDEEEVVISFRNSGRPLPKGFDKSDYIIKGARKGNSSGDGIGGWLINEVIEAHRGSLELKSLNPKDSISQGLVTAIDIRLPVQFTWNDELIEELRNNPPPFGGIGR